MHGPTHNRGHTLDLLISRGLNISSIVIKDVALSDHFCIFFDILISVTILSLSERDALHLHLADAFIQSDLQCIRDIHFLSVCVFPGNRTHNLCAANAML